MKLAALILAIAAAGSAWAGSLVYTARFGEDDVELRQSFGMTFPGLSGAWLRGEPGTPLLPAASFVLVLPAGATSVEVRAAASDPVPVGDAVLVAPAPVLESLDRADGMQARTASQLVYGSDDPWPQDVLVSARTGNLCGFTLVSCMVQPWSYRPLSGRLDVFSTVDLQVSWEPGPSVTLSRSQASNAVWRLERLVDNPEDLAAFSPPVRGETQGDVEHLIVCDSSFVDEFQPLADFHNGEGLTCGILTTQEVVSGWPGIDDPERLRNCLRDYWENAGTVSVLLAGDDTVLPTRFVISECEGWFDYAPTDLYFADLDGTWDGNGDGEYGQPDDDLDLYADLLVGRVPMDTPEEAATFVDKTTGYMSAPPPGDWSTEAVLCGAVLFEEQGYISGKGCDSIAAALPASWEIVKVYEVLYGSAPDTQVQYITDGSGWNHYAAHGTYRGLWWHDQSKAMMSTWMADTLWNGDRTGIHTSIGCHPGAYQEEDECLAEVLLLRPDRGAVGVFFNTSYGWEGFWPEIGSSERMCMYLAQMVFQEQAPSLGLAFAAARDLEIQWLHGGYDRVLQSLLSWTAFHDPPLRVLGVPETHVIPPQPLYMTPPWPNPATRDAPVAFRVMFDDGPLQVAVHDLAGRLMWSGQTSPGERTVWEGNGPSGNRVPAGVYIVTARYGDVMTCRKVTVLD